MRVWQGDGFVVVGENGGWKQIDVFYNSFNAFNIDVVTLFKELARYNDDSVCKVSDYL